MKNTILTVKNALAASFVLAAFIFLNACTKGEVAVTFNVTGSASGAQTQPASNSNGSGTFNGTYNQQTNLLTYTCAWTSLSGAPISAAFHTGATGQSGISFNNWSLGGGLSSSGSFSGSVVISESQEASLLAGNCYYLITTAAHASGEVRGQLSASKQ